MGIVDWEGLSLKEGEAGLATVVTTFGGGVEETGAAVVCSAIEVKSVMPGPGRYTGTVCTPIPGTVICNSDSVRRSLRRTDRLEATRRDEDVPEVARFSPDGDEECDALSISERTVIVVALT